MTRGSSQSAAEGLSLQPPSQHSDSSSASSEEPWAQGEDTTSDEYLDFMADLTGAVDDSFAMLLSLGEDQQEVAKVAVHTVYKMVLNLRCNKAELKFRSAV